MKVDIAIKALLQIGDSVCSLIDLLGGGFKFGMISNISAICKEVKNVAETAHTCFPELLDMEDKDKDKLLEASYDMAKKIVKKIAH